MDKHDAHFKWIDAERFFSAQDTETIDDSLSAERDATQKITEQIEEVINGTSYLELPLVALALNLLLDAVKSQMDDFLELKYELLKRIWKSEVVAISTPIGTLNKEFDNDNRDKDKE